MTPEERWAAWKQALNQRLAAYEAKYQAELEAIRRAAAVKASESARKPAGPTVHRMRIRVTACSPQDPGDVEYYRRNGYAGADYNIAADYRQFPKGTKIRIPGYLAARYPGKFWEVDSPGGSVIRRSARKGVKHVDVKFRTLYSVRQWGSQWLDVEVIYPER